MFRRLRVLAAFFVLPIALVFANPVTANAVSSGVLSISLTDGGLPFGSADCKLPFAVVAGGISIGATSRCDAGPDFSPNSCQPFEGDCGSYGLVFKGVTGATCGSVALTPYSDASNDVSSVSARLGAGFAPITWTSCVPVQACLSYYWAGNLVTTGVDVVGCVTAPVTPPETGWEPPAEMPFGNCALGTPSGASWAHVVTYTDTGQAKYVKDKLRLLFDQRSTVGVTWTAAEREWTLNSIHSLAGNPPTPVAAASGGMQLPSGSESHPTTTDGTANTMNPTWMSDVQWLNNPTGIAGQHAEKNPPWMPYGMQVTTKGPLATANIPIGYTNPAKCTFWLGPKIRPVDHSTYGSSTPWGELISEADYNEPVPEVDPPSVEPPVSDQPDTDTGLFSGILRVLRSIWNAITGLVGQMKTGLRDLFIPDDGYMDSAFDDLASSWDNTSIVRWIGAYENFDVGSGSGCEGLALNVTLPGGVDVSEGIGAACSGPMASAASVVRMVLSAVFVVAGGIACLRGIGAGFGWSPSIGKGESS